MNIGIFYTENNINYYLCTCGNNWSISQTDLVEDTDRFCNKCGCHHFKNVAPNFNGGNITYEAIVLIEKQDWGFILEREKFNLKYNKKINTLVFLESVYCWKLIYSFKDDLFVYSKSDGIQYKINIEFLKLFFKGYNDQDMLIDLISTPNNKKLFEYAISKFGYVGRYSNKLSYGLSRFVKYKKIELFFKCGYNMYTIYNLMDRYNSKDIDFSKNKPTEILGVPKYAIQYIKPHNFSPYTLGGIRELHKNFGGNDCKIILSYLREETDSMISFLGSSNIAEFINLIKNCNYKPKQLIRYLTRGIKLEQGILDPIDGLTLLKDYVSMSNRMGVEYNKYSKSLKKDHDICSMNYKVTEDSRKKEYFRNVISSNKYKELIYNNKEYSIIIPQEPIDMISEGKLLSHCVASYVDDVINGKCKILFMRKTDSLESSLLTIEIRENNIIQIKGFSNRSRTEEEDLFIKKWSKEKELGISA